SDDGSGDRSRAGTRARAQEHAVGLGALRVVLAALRRHGWRRVRLPLARLSRDPLPAPAKPAPSLLPGSVEPTPGVWITGPSLGPAGRRLAVKDLFDTAGVRTTYGSAVFGEHVPVRTAAAVAALEERGWVSVGKTNLHEFAYGVTSQNLHY